MSVSNEYSPASRKLVACCLQYIKLGGRLLGFNVDPHFSDALDGLVLVDLRRTKRTVLERYMGKDRAAAFFSYQRPVT